MINPNQSENISELAKALSLTQGEMQAAIKDCVNPFFKSKYADLGSIWAAVRPFLSKNGLCVIQTTELLGEKTILVTTLAHSSGQYVKSYMCLNPSKNDSQGMGAAITYLRRYSLSAILGVVTDEDNDDDGETDVGRGKNSKPEINNGEQPIHEMQLSALESMLSVCDSEFVANFKKNIDIHLGVKENREIKIKHYSSLINKIKTHLNNLKTEDRKDDLQSDRPTTEYS